ncbi:MAG TPA: ribonuclease J [Alphaproteobacteria bacterium]
MTEKLPNPGKDGVVFLPLGGCGQFGANLSLYGYDNSWIAIDLGMGFADERLPGVELILPNPSLIADQKEKLKALFITHAHEDHIGGIAWLWPQLQCPIYATPFTAALLERKFEEHAFIGKGPQIIIVKPGKPIELGDWKVSYLPVAHSIPEGNALVIETPAGRIVHTGDWCLDPDPVLGRKTDRALFTDIGDKGVLACLGDSTNAEVRGEARTESQVEAGLREVIKTAPRKIAITIFASNIGRLVSIYNAAHACGRHVALVGRSLRTMVECARETGYIEDHVRFLSEEDAKDVADDKLLLIVTGSQGEGRAALSRIAKGTHPSVKMKPGDTVVFSSRAIPGNEVAINDIKNALLADGVRVVTDRDAPIHVSGHPVREDLSQMLDWVRPRILVPVHGERTQMEAHASLGREKQIPFVHVPSNGEYIRLNEHGATVERVFTTNFQAIDLDRVVPADHLPILERRKVSFNGAVFVSLTADQDSGEVLDIRVTAVGLLDPELESDQELTQLLEDEIADHFESLPKSQRLADGAAVEPLRGIARRFFRERFELKPLCIVHIALV